jgi:hypothetical protein
MNDKKYELAPVIGHTHPENRYFSVAADNNLKQLYSTACDVMA